MSSQVILGVAHDCQAARRGRPILPAQVLHLRSGFRCVHRLPSLRFGTPSSSVVPYLEQHVAHSGQLYYRKDNFLTPSDCSKSKVLHAFLTACDDINTCNKVRSRTMENQEVVVVVQCVSSQSPSYCYYIVDHTMHTVRWLHERPKDSPADALVETRDIGEYWRHVHMFCAHRHITPGDVQNVRSLLNSLQYGSVLEPQEIKTYLDSLEILSRSEIGTDYTYTVGLINHVVVERSVPPVVKPQPTAPERRLASPTRWLKKIIEFFSHSPRVQYAESTLGHPSQHSASSRSSLDVPSRSRLTSGSSTTSQPPSPSDHGPSPGRVQFSSPLARTEN